MLLAAALMLGGTTLWMPLADAAGTLSVYSDSGEIRGWAKEGVALAAMANIVPAARTAGSRAATE